MPTAKINGTHLYYELHGARGPRLILLMGLRARGAAFHPLVERLRDDHQLAWFDHRGIGESDPLRSDTSMTEMAADAAGLMDHLGWARAHVLGVSMGGMAAQHFALEHRPRTRSLSLLVTTPHGPRTLLPSPRTFALYMRTLHPNPQRRFRHLSRLLYTDATIAREGQDALVEHLKVAFGHDHPGTWRAQLRAIAAHDVRGRLGALHETPTLIIGAGRDRLVPIAHSDHLSALLPHARYRRFDDAGHGVMAEEPDAVAGEVRAHVRSAEAA